MMEEKKDMLAKDQETALAVSPAKAVDSTDMDEDDEISSVIKFKKPYKFEGKEYHELDLSALENVRGEDLIRVNKRYSRSNPGVSLAPEITLEYALNLAADAVQLPIEFFTGLPGRYAMAVKNRVTAFLFGAE